MIYHQVEKNEVAVELIGKAIRVNSNGSMNCSLGNALKDQGKLEAALESFQPAQFLEPKHFRADAARFLLVVDSDLNKVGTFVPGTGQRIEFRDMLKNVLIDVVTIRTQLRARGNVAETEREGLVVRALLIERGAMMIDFHRGVHPHASKPAWLQ